MPDTNTTPSFFDFGTRQTPLLSMFMPLAVPVFKNTEITDGVVNSQDHMRRSVDANVALWRGALAAGFNSVDAFGRYLTASRDDFFNAISATSPIEFSQRQTNALHDRHRQLLGELRSVTDQLDAVWFQALESVTFPRPAAGTESGEASAESAEVADIAETPQRAEPASAESAEVADIAETPQRAEPDSETGAEASMPSDTGSRRPSPRRRQKEA